MPKRAKKTALTKLLRTRIIKPKSFPKGPAFNDMGTFTHVLDFSGVGLQTKFPWELQGAYNEKGFIKLSVCNVALWVVGRSSSGRRITFALPDSALDVALPYLSNAELCAFLLNVPAKFGGGAWGLKSTQYSSSQLRVPLGPLWKQKLPKRTTKPGRYRSTAHATKVANISRAVAREVEARRSMTGYHG